MRSFICNCIFEEIIPTLDLPEDESKDYANSVLLRFENPYIRHELSSIALNSVSKFKVRVLPSILAYKDRFGTYPKSLMFSLKKLLEFYKTDMTNDDPAITAYMRERTPKEILSNRDLWDTDLSQLYEALEYDNP